MGQEALGSHRGVNGSTNGTRNGSGSGNGVSSHALSLRRVALPHPGESLPEATFEESEYVRIIEQALYSLGYNDVAESLERQSGVQLQSEAVRDFQYGALNGDWDVVMDLLDRGQVGIKDGDGSQSGNEARSEQLLKAKFLILEQKYIEALEEGNLDAALKCLREELSPLKINTDRLHELASLMRYRTATDLLKSTKADDSTNGTSHAGGASDEPQPASRSRSDLLKSLQEVIPSSVMIPDGRLEQLVGQAIAYQVNRCMYYNKTDNTFSLLSDYVCGPEHIPSKTVQVLDAHSDEVWHVQFSCSGRFLASASADGTAMIWERDSQSSSSGSSSGGGKFVLKHELVGHRKQIAFVSWSPNDKYLLTCGNDNVLHLWDVETGTSDMTFDKHDDSVTSCAWFPDSERFVSGSIDKHIYLWSIHGSLVRQWKGSRVHDLAVSRSGKWMVSTSNEKKLHIYDLVNDTEEYISETESIISLCLSKHSDVLLVNLQNQKIHLWDLTRYAETRLLPKEPIQRYRGPNEKQGRYVIRSCFGGTNQAFVVSGSENSQVYIWHRAKGDLLKTLAGHSGTVNAVSWSPVDPCLFASASDDHSVRIWGA